MLSYTIFFMKLNLNLNLYSLMAQVVMIPCVRKLNLQFRCKLIASNFIESFSVVFEDETCR